MRRHLKPVLAVAAVIVTILAATVISLATARSADGVGTLVTTDTDRFDQATRDPIAEGITQPDPAITIDTEALGAYLAAVQEHEAWEFVRVWYEAEQAEQARIAEEQRQAEARKRATVPRSPAPAATGGGSGCVIPAYICQRESGMSYTALNPSSGAGGMYQLLPSTANAVARQIGRYDLIGVPPHLMAPADQDLLAATLWDGGRGCRHWLACQ
jgi:hypothetical protein